MTAEQLDRREERDEGIDEVVTGTLYAIVAENSVNGRRVSTDVDIQAFDKRNTKRVRFYGVVPRTYVGGAVGFAERRFSKDYLKRNPDCRNVLQQDIRIGKIEGGIFVAENPRNFVPDKVCAEITREHEHLLPYSAE